MPFLFGLHTKHTQKEAGRFADQGQERLRTAGLAVRMTFQLVALHFATSISLRKRTVGLLAPAGVLVRCFCCFFDVGEGAEKHDRGIKIRRGLRLVNLGTGIFVEDRDWKGFHEKSVGGKPILSDNTNAPPDPF